ncbi:MAG: Uma2 family endonuclease [Chloroherpetonaceae bacterium]
MTQVLAKKMTREEYLDFERNSEERYEFVNGELVKREMPRIIHEIIVGNLIVLLNAVLKGKIYRALPSGVKIDINAFGNYRYADVSVVPSENLDFESDILDNAVVLFEVSSKSTMNIDRGEKFEDYQTLASLKEYVLVSTEKVQVELFRRKTKNEWDYMVLNDKTMRLELKSIDAEMSVEEIYDGTKL